jgi:hypothetical protein
MTLQRFLAAAAALCVATVALAKDSPPQVTDDGLVLQKSKVAKVLYVRPGVDFSEYKRIEILECPVAFRKNWARDHASGPGRVSQKDMDAMKKGLSEAFMRIFTEELRDKGGYALATEGGEDVLVLRPAIVDLDVSAPDTMTAGRSYTMSEGSGAMTLYLEVFDSATGQILARAVDRETSRGNGRIQWQNRVTNSAEADRILRRWAVALRERLDAVRAGGAP